eukprot:TRINITY_DN32962_c0_g1_i1.p1 TRINITY_DN32962_c0_g1~~TRINITY_DN32962_c0_g1_i1.p1  ORF type:complete len:242 (-),score=10.97 TRINITY_DN32962_c0_g1_i1:268-993(-)
MASLFKKKPKAGTPEAKLKARQDQEMDNLKRRHDRENQELKRTGKVPRRDRERETSRRERSRSRSVAMAAPICPPAPHFDHYDPMCPAPGMPVAQECFPPEPCHPYMAAPPPCVDPCVPGYTAGFCAPPPAVIHTTQNLCADPTCGPSGQGVATAPYCGFGGAGLPAQGSPMHHLAAPTELSAHRTYGLPPPSHSHIGFPAAGVAGAAAGAPGGGFVAAAGSDPYTQAYYATAEQLARDMR